MIFYNQMKLIVSSEHTDQWAPILLTNHNTIGLVWHGCVVWRFCLTMLLHIIVESMQPLQCIFLPKKVAKKSHFIIFFQRQLLLHRYSIPDQNINCFFYSKVSLFFQNNERIHVTKVHKPSQET